MKNIWLQRIITATMLLIVVSLFLPPAEVVMADDSGISDFYDTDCPLSLAGYDRTYNNVRNTYPDDSDWEKTLNCSYGNPATDTSLDMSIVYYKDATEAQKQFNHDEARYKELDQSRQGKDYWELVHLLDFVSDNLVSGMYRSLYYYKTLNTYYGSIFMLMEYHFYAGIILQGEFADNQSALDLFQEAEKLAADIINSKITTFEFRHYELDWNGGGGIFEAVLYGKDGKAIAGKEVFLFRDIYRDVIHHDTFRFPENFWGGYDPLYYDQTNKLPITTAVLSPDHISISTDGTLLKPEGMISWNYLSEGAIKWDQASKRISKGESVKGTIYAVVFDKDPRQKYVDEPMAKIQHVASCTVEIKGVAAIINRGRKDDNKQPVVKLERNGQEFILSDALPIYVCIGDRIKIDNNARLTIKWINGTKMIFTSKEGRLGSGEFADIDIQEGDTGTLRWINSHISGHTGGIIMAVASSAIGAVCSKLNTAVWVASPKAGAVLGLVIYCGYKAWEYYSDNLEIIIRSEIFVSPDDESDGLSLYTIEGTATIYNPHKESTIDVTTGQKILISKDREFGLVEDFKTSELPAEIMQMVEIADLDSSSTSSGSVIISMPAGVGGQTTEQIESIEHSSDWAGVLPTKQTASETEALTVNQNIGIYLGYAGVAAAALFFILLIVRNSRRKQQHISTTPSAQIIQTQSSYGTCSSQKQPSPSEQINCSNCGAWSNHGAVYCRKCGAKFQDNAETTFCSRCGTANLVDANFCKKCGMEMQ